MANMNSILAQRMKRPMNTSKMAAMAQQSANGNLTSFSGVFSVSDLSSKEKEGLEEILKNYAVDNREIGRDLTQLISLTSEVKAINNQAALLHGERIKKAHQILINYREGAFTAWLMTAYGNRQTPYNLMQYYEFCESMPKQLKPQIELMPRQAVYTLASRTGSLKQKQSIVENYRGETKFELLAKIRQIFPLEQADRRKPKMGQLLIKALEKMVKQLKNQKNSFTPSEKNQIQSLLKQIHQMIGRT